MEGIHTRTLLHTIAFRKRFWYPVGVTLWSSETPADLIREQSYLAVVGFAALLLLVLRHTFLERVPHASAEGREG